MIWNLEVTCINVRKAISYDTDTYEHLHRSRRSVCVSFLSNLARVAILGDSDGAAAAAAAAAMSPRGQAEHGGSQWPNTVS